MDVVCGAGRPAVIWWREKIAWSIYIHAKMEREWWRKQWTYPWFSGTHWERRIMAKLEPSGPHITWAMLISCLLKESGESFQISETPSHTRYSLRSGTLKRHHTDSTLSQFRPHTVVYGRKIKKVRGTGSDAVTMMRSTVGRWGPTPLWSASPHTSASPWEERRSKTAHQTPPCGSKTTFPKSRTMCSQIIFSNARTKSEA